MPWLRVTAQLTLTVHHRFSVLDTDTSAAVFRLAPNTSGELQRWTKLSLTRDDLELPATRRMARADENAPAAKIRRNVTMTPARRVRKLGPRDYAASR